MANRIHIFIALKESQVSILKIWLYTVFLINIDKFRYALTHPPNYLNGPRKITQKWYSESEPTTTLHINLF